MRPDRLRKFLFERAQIRGSIARLDGAWQAVLARHAYPEPVRAVLGELFAAGALLAATLKFEGSLIMQIQGSGVLRLAVVECTADLSMRAMAQWGDLPEHGGQTFRDLVGGGRFVITLDPKDGKQTYQGIVALEGETVAEVLGHYMATSEQLETQLILTADATHAAGMLVQKLPEKADTAIDVSNDDWNRITHLVSTLTADELNQLPARTILHRLFHEDDVRVFDAQGICFSCTCSRERVVTMLRMLGYDEVRTVLEESGQIEVTCEFCNEPYQFDAVDAEQIFAADIVVSADHGNRH